MPPGRRKCRSGAVSVSVGWPGRGGHAVSIVGRRAVTGFPSLRFLQRRRAICPSTAPPVVVYYSSTAIYRRRSRNDLHRFATTSRDSGSSETRCRGDQPNQFRRGAKSGAASSNPPVRPRLTNRPGGASYLGVSLATFDCLRARGIIHAVPVPAAHRVDEQLRTPLFDYQDLDQLVDQWKREEEA